MNSILGYREDPKLLENGEYDWEGRSYNFRSITESKKGMIATAAVMTCSDCGSIIKSMGGPGYRCYCLKCYEALKVKDFALGHEHKIQE